MARTTRTAISGDINMHLNAAIRRNRVNIGKRSGEKIVGNLAFNRGHADPLRLAHHGMVAKTRHGLGGIKPHQIKPPRVPKPKSSLRIVHSTGVRIPSSMHAPRPGKGMGNHLKRVI